MNTIQHSKFILCFFILTTQTIFSAESFCEFSRDRHGEIYGKLKAIRGGKEPSRKGLENTSAVITHINLTGEDLHRHGENLAAIEKARAAFSLLDWKLGRKGMDKLRSCNESTQRDLQNPLITKILQDPTANNIITATFLADIARSIHERTFAKGYG